MPRAIRRLVLYTRARDLLSFQVSRLKPTIPRRPDDPSATWLRSGPKRPAGKKTRQAVEHRQSCINRLRRPSLLAVSRQARIVLMCRFGAWVNVANPFSPRPRITPDFISHRVLAHQSTNHLTIRPNIRFARVFDGRIRMANLQRSLDCGVAGRREFQRTFCRLRQATCADTEDYQIRDGSG